MEKNVCQSSKTFHLILLIPPTTTKPKKKCVRKHSLFMEAQNFGIKLKYKL